MTLALDLDRVTVYEDDSTGTWYAVRLASFGHLYLVRVTGSDSPDSAIEAAIDAAIANDHEGVFHEAEYPDRAAFDDDDDAFAEACEDAEVDMHVVGHTTVPEGWGTWIPSWEITVGNASPEHCELAERLLAEREAA